MKLPAALFKKKITKLYLFLKAKQKLINTVVCCLHKRKDVKCEEENR